MKPISAMLLVIGLAGSLLSCQSSQSAPGAADRSSAAKNYPLKVSFQADYVQMVATPVTALWNADSNSQHRGGRINIAGEGHSLTLRGNSVNADLPYYGQRDMFRGVYDEPTIIFKEKTLENITYGRTADRKIVMLEFDVRQNTERFHVQLVILRDKKAYLLLNSPQRQSIRYEGRVEVLQAI
ncbi:MAG TPA: DUF4251 domain-containing protein [Robiginitalea sp.]|nr:DUF4251 domain-containing protein [Robiginitalea sp.]